MNSRFPFMPGSGLNGPFYNELLVRQIFPAIYGHPFYPRTWQNCVQLRLRPWVSQHLQDSLVIIHRAVQSSTTRETFVVQFGEMLELHLQYPQPRTFLGNLPSGMQLLQCLLVIADHAGSTYLAQALHNFIIGRGRRILKTHSLPASFELAVDIFHCRPMAEGDIVGCLREVIRGNPNVLRGQCGMDCTEDDPRCIGYVLRRIARRMHDFDDPWMGQGMNMPVHPLDLGRRAASLDDINRMRQRLTYGLPQLGPWDVIGPQLRLGAPISVNDYALGEFPRRIKSLSNLDIRRNHHGGWISQLAHIQAELQHGQADLQEKVGYLLARDAMRGIY